jgi:hypothetical protein
MQSETPVAPSRWQRPPVLVVGAHRSGTTATVRALEILGLQTGQRLDSHHESKVLQRLHETYLRGVGAAWYRPGPFLEWANTPEGAGDCVKYLRQNIRHEFRRVFGYRNSPRGLGMQARIKLGAAWGWKEPRTTLFAPFWLQIFPNARVVEVIRHPLAVAMSIRQRELEFRAGGDPATPQLEQLDYCLRLALTYVEAGERLVRLTPNYCRIRFEEIQANPLRTLAELAGFCGLRPTSARIAKSAASIRPERPPEWQALPEEEVRELLRNHPMVEKLGYRS